MLQQRQMSASRSVRPAISARSIPTTVEYLTLTNATRAFKTKSSVRSLLVLAVFVFVMRRPAYFPVLPYPCLPHPWLGYPT